jgi:hypothetical protein
MYFQLAKKDTKNYLKHFLSKCKEVWDKLNEFKHMSKITINI